MCSTRRGQLANARKTKLTQIPVECFSDVQMPDPRENVANLTEMANFIKENGTEDFKVYSDTMCAIYRGVSCPSVLGTPAQLSVLQWCVPCVQGQCCHGQNVQSLCNVAFCISKLAANVTVAQHIYSPAFLLSHAGTHHQAICTDPCAFLPIPDPNRPHAGGPGKATLSTQPAADIGFSTHGGHKASLDVATGVSCRADGKR